MYTRVVQPRSLAPEELDAYLEDGWYRIGQTLMTCRFVVLNGSLRSAVWLRLPLRGHQFRKSLRKLTRKIEREFRVEVGPIKVDAQREDLYSRYLMVAQGDRPRSLDSFLFGGSETNLFDTREVAIWEGGRLVGFSWFDTGIDSVQSLIGVYDPAYSRFSLGFYTMLAEVRYGLDHDMGYFYPGYVLPGEPAMDYKLRLGDELEFLDMELGLWRALSDLDSYPLPTDRLLTALESVQRDLADNGVHAVLRENPMFEVDMPNPGLPPVLREPMLLEWRDVRDPRLSWGVVWDLDRRAYAVVRLVEAVARFRSPGPQGELREESAALWLVLGRRGPLRTIDALLTDLNRRRGPRR